MTGGWKRWRRPLRDIGIIIILLITVSFLPPDTSLADRRQQGDLRFCVPDLTSPLINGADPQSPGHELALMQSVAKELGLRLRLVEVANMGRSFNPRDWQVGRGQCDILGGGFAGSASNRGFLTLLPTGDHIRLVRIGPETPPAAGTEVGVFLGSAGMDRLALSGWMRAQGWQARPLATLAELQSWTGMGNHAIASSLTPLPNETRPHDLPDEAAQSSDLVFGLWRGDVTLTRAIRSALHDVRG